MVCLKSQHVNTPAGCYVVALYINGIDYEVDVRDPLWRHRVLGRFDPEQRDRAHELYASTVWALTPAVTPHEEKS